MQETQEMQFNLWVRKCHPLQYSDLENSMYRGAWWTTVHGVTESDVAERLNTHTHTHTHTRINYIDANILRITGAGKGVSI